MNPYLLVLLMGLLFVLAYGGLTQLRREGLSTQFIVECLAVTGVALLAMAVTGQAIHPLAFLAVIYLVTLRVRLTVDLANRLVRSGRARTAFRLYDLAEGMAPDASGRALIVVNRAALLLSVHQTRSAVEMLEGLLGAGRKAALSVKHQSAAHYNLGLGYLKLGRDAKAVDQLNRAIEVWPASTSAQRARRVLDSRGAEHAKRMKGGEPSRG